MECHICSNSPLNEAQDVFALNCGHICCAPCLEACSTTSHQQQPICICPSCRHTSQDQIAASGPLRLKLSNNHDNVSTSSSSLVKLDKAVDDATVLQRLLQKSLGTEKLTTGNLRVILNESEGLHSALKELYRVRELQELMSDISNSLTSIKNSLASQDELGIVRRELEEQKALEKLLRRRLEERNASTTRPGAEEQKRLHEFEPIRSQLGPFPSGRYVDNPPQESLASFSDGATDAGPSISVPYPPVDTPAEKPVPGKRAMAFLEYYCRQRSMNKERFKVEALPPSEDNVLKWSASMILGGRPVGTAEGRSVHHARINCYRVVAGQFRSTDRPLWEEFLRTIEQH